MTAKEADRCSKRLARAGADRVYRQKLESAPGVLKSSDAYGVNATVSSHGRERERIFWNVSEVDEFLGVEEV